MRAMSANKISHQKAAPPKDDVSKGLHETMPFQRREWVVQRIGWTLMGLVLLAGLLGVFGGGPLAHRTSANAALAVEYDWLTRRDSQTSWKLTPRTPPVDGRHRVALDANWAQHIRINAIQPEPESARLAEGRWVYVFEAREVPGLPIVFHVEARKMGPLEGSIVFNDAPPLQIAQFVYP
jgi:hypothetical protein